MHKLEYYCCLTGCDSNFSDKRQKSMSIKKRQNYIFTFDF